MTGSHCFRMPLIFTKLKFAFSVGLLTLGMLSTFEVSSSASPPAALPHSEFVLTATDAGLLGDVQLKVSEDLGNYLAFGSGARAIYVTPGSALGPASLEVKFMPLGVTDPGGGKVCFDFTATSVDVGGPPSLSPEVSGSFCKEIQVSQDGSLLKAIQTGNVFPSDLLFLEIEVTTENHAGKVGVVTIDLLL